MYISLGSKQHSQAQQALCTVWAHPWSAQVHLGFIRQHCEPFPASVAVLGPKLAMQLGVDKYILTIGY